MLNSSGYSQMQAWPPGSGGPLSTRDVFLQTLRKGDGDQYVPVAGEHQRRRLDAGERSVVSWCWIDQICAR